MSCMPSSLLVSKLFAGDDPLQQKVGYLDFIVTKTHEFLSQSQYVNQ